MNCPIDFSLLLGSEDGYAVHCSTQEEASEFVELSKTLYPKLCINWLPKEDRFEVYKENSSYTFDIKKGSVWSRIGLRYGPVSVLENLGYKIVEFSEINHPDDLDESDKSIDFLLN